MPTRLITPIEENVLGEEGIEPFDWEDYLYESWLEEHLDRKRNRPADGVLV